MKCIILSLLLVCGIVSTTYANGALVALACGDTGGKGSNSSAPVPHQGECRLQTGIKYNKIYLLNEQPR